MSLKLSSSQASWHLLNEGVSQARLEAHRLRHMLSRVLELVSIAEDKERIYRLAGDLITAAPDRLDQLELVLDRTALALSRMGEEFLGARLPLDEKSLLDDTLLPAQTSREYDAAVRLARRVLRHLEGSV